MAKDGLGQRIKDDLKREAENEVRRAENAVRNKVSETTRAVEDGIHKGINGLFTKKVKYTENEDGSISREMKVGKQKINMKAIRNDDGSYLVTNMAELDDKNMKKITEKISKGKRLSNDEQLWVHVHDKMAVAIAIKNMGYDVSATTHLPYMKEQLTGEQDVGTFFVDIQEFEGDKTAFLSFVKERMVEVYGAEAGEKHFEDFAAASGLTGELQKLADREKAAAEAQKPAAEKEAPVEVKEAPAAEKEAPVEVKETPVEVKEAPVEVKEAPVEVKETPVIEPQAKVKDGKIDENTRKEIHDEMKSDAAKKSQVVVEPRGQQHPDMSVKDEMKNDGKVAATRGLLSRHGVKLADKEDTLKKLVENFGAEAAYEIALKCIVEPANAMSAMGEGFKRSGASLEYFAAIDPKDTEKMAKVAELAGVPVKPVKTETKEPPRRMEPIANAKGVSPASMVNGHEGIVAPVKLEKSNFMAEQKYAEMCKKLNKEALTVEDLVNIGATRQDFDATVKKVLGEKATGKDIQSKVAKGFGVDGTSPVTKDFALEVIGRVEDRKMLASRMKGRSY